MREALIETRLFRGVELRGGRAVKLRVRTWPDRFVLWQYGIVHFIELKKPKGSKFEPGQLRKHQELRSRGFVCVCLYTYEHVDEYFEYVETVTCHATAQGDDPSFNPGKDYVPAKR